MPANDRITRLKHSNIPECPGYLFGADGSIWSQWHAGVKHADWPWRRRNGSAKLTEPQVREIRRIVAAGARSRRSIAAQFGVAHGTINRLVNGQGWHHVK
jgi:hypothetical protein